MPIIIMMFVPPVPITALLFSDGFSTKRHFRVNVKNVNDRTEIRLNPDREIPSSGNNIALVSGKERYGHNENAAHRDALGIRMANARTSEQPDSPPKECSRSAVSGSARRVR